MFLIFTLFFIVSSSYDDDTFYEFKVLPIDDYINDCFVLLKAI